MSKPTIIVINRHFTLPFDRLNFCRKIVNNTLVIGWTLFIKSASETV